MGKIRETLRLRRDSILSMAIIMWNEFQQTIPGQWALLWDNISMERIMNNDKIGRDEIREYEAQFKKSMAEIAAYQAKAGPEIAEIRAIIKGIGEKQDKTELLIQKSAEKHDKTELLLQKVAEQQRELNTNWGRLVESLVEGSLVELLNERGIEVHRTHPRQKVSYVQKDGTHKNREFDIVVANGEEVVVVEVKTTLKPKHIKRFVESMKDFSRYFPYYATMRVYGAVAYIRCDSDTDRFAYKKGLYVIRATGDSASILNDSKFKPKSFTEESSGPPKVHLRAVPDC